MNDRDIRTLIGLIEEAITQTERTSDVLSRMRQFVGESSAEGVPWDIARDLIWDLSFYEPDVSARREDPSYYGDDRLKEELWIALRKLQSFCEVC